MDRKLVLITGGHGFIGSHVAQKLYSDGDYRVRIVDIVPKPSYIEGEICHEFVLGNLCDPHFCRAIVDGVHIVLHFAANMGGMGTIHDANDFAIYTENQSMTISLLRGSIEAGVERFLYASTACVYPEHLQRIPIVDPDLATTSVSLREDDVYRDATSTSPPSPQGLYGLEKLVTELLLHQLSPKINIRVARLHNVYGPGGSWSNGREKAPAAFLRKALALKRLESHSSEAPFEIWGDGSQRRSFLYIDDAVEAILSLLHSNYSFPLNIGSDTPVSVKRLANIAAGSVGLDPLQVSFAYDRQKPVGVASRNSNNDRVAEVLGWRPQVSLAAGMRLTGDWMSRQMDVALSISASRDTLLRSYLSSNVVDLKTEDVVFGILLPITSRGGPTPESCLENLTNFARSLQNTTWRDIREIGGRSYRIAIYLAIDHDDAFLRSGSSRNKAEDLLRREGFANVVSLICEVPRGHVCALWRECARKAWEDGCEYMGLFGDDVELLDEGWMRRVDSEFHQIAEDGKVPFGIGCVAFTDISFPGMPTFPIVHRRHLDIFKGEVVPEIFINQDGDPFLYQLYRRWNASIMINLRLSNRIGGSVEARYEKQHADWTFDTLSDAVATVDTHIRRLDPSISPALTLDIIIPCFRVDISILSPILSLQHPPTLTVMFIIIIDNPSSPSIRELEGLYGHRTDVRIRVNRRNVGASASRNRGLTESSAEWAHFLDDDVIPDKRLLFAVEEIIRQHPNAAGFVGNSIFPKSETVFQTAVHLAGVTYFWDIASKLATPDDVPWGVTANLIARRNVRDGINFDLRYPKTGGGEDIDFCRLKRAYSIERGGTGFIAAPKVEVTHPYWNNGLRSYRRFYMWAYGDGMLISRFPQLSYRDHAPNSAEWLFLTACLSLIALPLRLSPLHTATLALKAITTIFVTNVLHDLYRHLWKHPERNVNMNASIKSGPLFGIALIESTFIRMYSELGRLRGVLDRQEWVCIGKRFEWFAGRAGSGPMNEERWNNVERATLIILIFCCVL